MFQIVRESRDSAALLELVRLLDVELNARYGALQSQYDQYNSLADVRAAVVVYAGDQPIGCGCFKRFDDQTAEIKRMFVRPEHRGSGVAPLLIGELEKWALEAGFLRAVLETGVKNSDALRFYAKCGYSKIKNYGQYAEMETSICMEKPLASR